MLKSLLPTTILLIFAISTHAQRPIEGHMLVNNIKREYIVHLPSGNKTTTGLPVVLIFHGGGGNTLQMQRYMDMDDVADKEKFITVYPQGIKGAWNDGRDFKYEISAEDDVQFISQLIDSLAKKYAVNTMRIFATGMSNGGFFSLYLSYRLSHKILAVAPVCATIPQKIYNEFYPANPISLLLINGTKDPLVPYDGGVIGNKMTGDRGESSATDSTIERFITINQTAREPHITSLPDKNRFDGCQAIQYTYNNELNHTTITLVKVINGGHTLPGASQYLPKFVTGKVCRDFEAHEMIWEFFKQCPTRGLRAL